MAAPGRALARRVALEGSGWVLLVVGIAAIPLPGPGLLMIFGGMLLLSQQYEWAERRVDQVRLRALGAAADSVQTVPRIIASGLGALAIMAFGVLWIWHPPAPSWWPVRESWWLLGGWATGVVLVGSGLVALGLLVYSFRRFRGDPQEREELAQEIAET